MAILTVNVQYGNISDQIFQFKPSEEKQASQASLVMWKIMVAIKSPKCYKYSNTKYMQLN